MPDCRSTWVWIAHTTRQGQPKLTPEAPITAMRRPGNGAGKLHMLTASASGSQWRQGRGSFSRHKKLHRDCILDCLADLKTCSRVPRLPKSNSLEPRQMILCRSAAPTHLRFRVSFEECMLPGSGDGESLKSSWQMRVPARISSTPWPEELPAWKISCELHKGSCAKNRSRWTACRTLSGDLVGTQRITSKSGCEEAAFKA